MSDKHFSFIPAPWKTAVPSIPNSCSDTIRSFVPIQQQQYKNAVQCKLNLRPSVENTSRCMESLMNFTFTLYPQLIYAASSWSHLLAFWIFRKSWSPQKALQTFNIQAIANQVKLVWNPSHFGHDFPSKTSSSNTVKYFYPSISRDMTIAFI